jgi:hypothetical protein
MYLFLNLLLYYYIYNILYIYIHTDFDTYSKYVTWFPLDFGCQHGPYRDDFNDVHPEMLMSAFLMHVPMAVACLVGYLNGGNLGCPLVN